MSSRSQIQARADFAFGIVIFLFILLFVSMIAIAIYFGKWQGVQDVSCKDWKPCTNDLVYPDHTCQNPRFQNGTFCSPGDVCFNTSSTSFCIDGICQGPSRQWCRGFCNVDADCPDLPFSDRLSPTIVPEIDCIQQSCVYTITGGLTDQCLSWIDFTPDNPVVAEGCLTYRFTDEAYAYPPGICLIRYICAPFNFNPDLMSLDISYSNIYNQSNEAILYFKNKNILFDDIPLYGQGLLHIHEKFKEVLSRSKTNHQSRIEGLTHHKKVKKPVSSSSSSKKTKN